jgi:predicted RND superfamily exporter protein
MTSLKKRSSHVQQQLDRGALHIAGVLIGNYKRVIAVFAVIAALLVPSALNIRLDPGYSKSVPENHPYTKTFQMYQKVFGGGNEVIIALSRRPDDGRTAIEDPKFLEVLSKVTDEIFFLPGVNRPSVRSIFTPNVHFVAVTEEGFRGGNIVPSQMRARPGELDASELREIRENLFKSDEVGRLVAGDLSGALVRAEVLEMDPAGNRLDYREFARKLDVIRETYSDDEISVAIIGFPKFIGEVIDAVTRGGRYFALALGVTLLMLRAFVGSWVLSGCAVLVAVVAVVCQLGIVGSLGYGVDPLSILVPFLIFAIAVSHAIQMCNAWVKGVAAGASAPEAARQAFIRLFIPGTTALLGNAVGFAVIMLIDVPIIKELGVTASIGVAIMIVTNKLLLPAVLCLLSPKYAPPERGAKVTDTVFHSLAALTRGRRGVVVLGIAGILLASAIHGRNQLKIGDVGDGVPELYPSSQYNRDLSLIAASYAIGVDSFVVVAESKPESCTNSEVLAEIEALEWELRKKSYVQSVVALPDYVKKGYVGNNEGYPKWSMIPQDSTLIALTIRPIELSAGLFNSDCSALPISVYTKGHDADTIKALVHDVEEYAGGRLGGLVDFKLALGNVGVMAAINDVIEGAQLTMLISLFLATGMLCLATFLSWRAAVCVVAPLVLSAIMCDAVMAWMGIGLKIPTLPVVALGVGVGVDYGIYLLARAMTELRMGRTTEEAFQYALEYAGRPIVFTAVTMSFGMVCWLFSPLKFQADMAFLLIFMFLFNMFGALVILPALAGRLLCQGRVDKTDEGIVACDSGVFRPESC